MGKILVFANEKGGIGKTTSAVNVAACIGAKGKKVLLIDSDPQGNATSGVGVNKKTAGSGVYEVISGQTSAEKALVKTRFDNLWLIPSNIALAGAAYELISVENYNKLMKNALECVKDSFDYIIVDCPPSLGMLTINSFTASDGIIVPMQCEFYALEGLSQLMITISKIKAHYNNKLTVTGILLTMYTNRLLLTQQVKNEIKKHYAGKLFETHISRGVKLSEAPGFGMPVYYHDKRGKGSNEYLAVANELSTRI